MKNYKVPFIDGTTRVFEAVNKMDVLVTLQLCGLLDIAIIDKIKEVK